MGRCTAPSAARSILTPCRVSRAATWCGLRQRSATLAPASRPRPHGRAGEVRGRRDGPAPRCSRERNSRRGEPTQAHSTSCGTFQAAMAHAVTTTSWSYDPRQSSSPVSSSVSLRSTTSSPPRSSPTDRRPGGTRPSCAALQGRHNRLTTESRPLHPRSWGHTCCIVPSLRLTPPIRRIIVLRTLHRRRPD